MFIRFDMIHERDRQTDRQTDGQTPHDSIDRTCIASRGKNRETPWVTYSSLWVAQKATYPIKNLKSEYLYHNKPV